MPIKKPKAVKLPLPFQDLSLSTDDNVRRRGILMKRELEQVGGFSWSAPGRGYANPHRPVGRRLLFAGGALLMGGVLVGALMLASDTGFTPGPQIIYVRSWSGDRTAADAIAERDADMAGLRQRYIEQQAQIATSADAAGDADAAQAAREAAARVEEQARAEALERERAAARAASPS